MDKPQVTKLSKTPESRVSGVSGKSDAKPVDRAQEQLASFESGMKLFHARKLADARQYFETASEGPECDVAQRARLHIAMCDRRLREPAISLKSAEDYYNYGIALLNVRDAPQARIYLERALQMLPGADHIHYALSAAQALSGDLSAAHENLKRAIEIEPRNRMLARQDSDFAAVMNHPPFDSLLYPEKKNW